MTMDIRWSTFYNCVLDLVSSITVFGWLSKIYKWISGWVHSMYSRVYRNWLSTFFVIFYRNLNGNSAFFIGLQECDILLLSPSRAGDNLVVCHPLMSVNWFPLIDGTRYEIICAFDKVWKHVVILSLSWYRLLLRFTRRHQTDGYFYYLFLAHLAIGHVSFCHG